MIDFHCHLDLFAEPQQIVGECVQRELYVLSVTTTPSAWKGTSQLVAGAKRIRIALGLHPELAAERKHELDLFDSLLPETRYVGEIGLDGTPALKRFWADQVYVFEHILAACETAGGKIISIHSKRAATEVLDRLEAFKNVGIPVLHWYSGTQNELNRAIDLGCWFSIGPAMLAGDKGRALASRLPRERILTETDAPFAMVAGRALYPWDAKLAVNSMASMWGAEERDVEDTLRDNLRRLTSM
jgi:TatD DNase family protein